MMRWNEKSNTKHAHIHGFTHDVFHCRLGTKNATNLFPPNDETTGKSAWIELQMWVASTLSRVKHHTSRSVFLWRHSETESHTHTFAALKQSRLYCKLWIENLLENITRKRKSHFWQKHLKKINKERKKPICRLRSDCRRALIACVVTGKRHTICAAFFLSLLCLGCVSNACVSIRSQHSVWFWASAPCLASKLSRAGAHAKRLTVYVDYYFAINLFVRCDRCVARAAVIY